MRDGESEVGEIETYYVIGTGSGIHLSNSEQDSHNTPLGF